MRSTSSRINLFGRWQIGHTHLEEQPEFVIFLSLLFQALLRTQRSNETLCTRPRRRVLRTALAPLSSSSTQGHRQSFTFARPQPMAERLGRWQFVRTPHEIHYRALGANCFPEPRSIQTTSNGAQSSLFATIHCHDQHRPCQETFGRLFGQYSHTAHCRWWTHGIGAGQSWLKAGWSIIDALSYSNRRTS